MKKTFKTMLALMLVCIMAVALMGTMAFADGETVTIHYSVNGETQPDASGTISGNKLVVTSDGTVYAKSIAFSNGGTNIISQCDAAVDSVSISIPFSDDGSTGFKNDDAHHEIWVEFVSLPTSVSYLGGYAKTAEDTIDFGATYAPVATKSGSSFAITIPTAPTYATYEGTLAILSNGAVVPVTGSSISPLVDFALLSIYTVKTDLPAALSHDNYVKLAKSEQIDLNDGFKARAIVSADNNNYSNIQVYSPAGVELHASEYTNANTSYTPDPVAAAITVKAPNASAAYTGQPIEVTGTPAVTVGTLFTGDTVSATYTNLPSAAGTHTGGIIIDKLTFKNGSVDVSKYYPDSSITKEAGDAEISKIAITVAAKDSSVAYDGKLHQSTEVEVTAGSLVSGDSITAATFTGGATTVAESPKASPVGSVTIKNANGDTVTDSYVITYDNAKGLVTIDKRPISLKVNNSTAVYTGSEISVSAVGATVSSGSFASGESLSSITTAGKGTSVGSHNIEGTDVVIKNGSVDTTANYDVTVVPGTLEITSKSGLKGDVTITFGGTKPFDGAVLAKYYDIVISAEAKNAGVANVKVEPVSGHPVLGSNAFTKVMGESDVTIKLLKADGSVLNSSDFNVKVVSGEVSITKLPLTITPSSVSKNYDGQPFVGKINAGKALAGTTINVTAEAKPYDVDKGGFREDKYVPTLGEHTLKVVESSVLVKNSLGQNVTDNFDITYKDAKLTIKAAIGSANYSKSAGGTVSINCTMPNSLLSYVMVDTKILTLDTDYTINKSVESTVITFRNSYLKTLDVGTHAVVYGYNDGSTISAKLTVTATGATTSTAAPKTGDNSNIVLWIVILAICLAGGVAIAVVLIRQKKKNQVEGQ